MKNWILSKYCNCGLIKCMLNLPDQSNIASYTPGYDDFKGAKVSPLPS